MITDKASAFSVKKALQPRCVRKNLNTTNETKTSTRTKKRMAESVLNKK